MDFKKLIPDFGAIGTTEWNKPKFDTKDIMWLAGAICAALVVVFAFFPAWFGFEKVESGSGYTETLEASRMGIGLWYGIFAFIGALVALYGFIYERYQFAFWGGVIIVLMAIIGIASTPEFEVTQTVKGGGYSDTDVETILGGIIGKTYLNAQKIDASHLGAILSLIAGAGVSVCSFLKINKQ